MLELGRECGGGNKREVIQVMAKMIRQIRVYIYNDDTGK